MRINLYKSLVALKEKTYFYSTYNVVIFFLESFQLDFNTYLFSYSNYVSKRLNDSSFISATTMFLVLFVMH